MQSLKLWLQQVGIGAIAVASIFAIMPSSQAADEIVFRYGILRQRLAVSELTKFAETGEESPVLARYLRRANAQPAEVRRILSQPLTIDRNTLDRGLNNVAGDFLINELSAIVKTPNDEDNQEALRNALLGSTVGDNKVTLLEVLQNYPNSEVHIDVKQAIRTYDRIAKYQQPIQNILQRVGPLRDILKNQGIKIP